MPDDRQIMGRRLGGIKQRQRLARALLAQQVGREIEPHPRIAGLTRQGLAQQSLCGLAFAADAHEGAKFEVAAACPGSKEST